MPGLELYVRAQFTEGLAGEIRELALTVAELQARYNAEVEPALEAPVERGEHILSELYAALSFLFDDGVNALEDKQLAKLKKAATARSSHDALAASLDSIGGYAAKHRKRLKALPRFDAQLIDEAHMVARRLRDQSATKAVRDPWRGRHGIRRDRARVTRLLHERMNIARRTIRYAFADQPEVVERATSQYRRQRQQEQRARKRPEKPEPA